MRVMLGGPGSPVEATPKALRTVNSGSFNSHVTQKSVNGFHHLPIPFQKHCGREQCHKFHNAADWLGTSSLSSSRSLRSPKSLLRDPPADVSSAMDNLSNGEVARQYDTSSPSTTAATRRPLLSCREEPRTSTLPLPAETGDGHYRCDHLIVEKARESELSQSV